MYIPPKWHRDKLGGKSPATEEKGYRDFKVNAVDVAIEKEMILREYNRRKEPAGGHVMSAVDLDEDDIPVLKPGQVESRGGMSMNSHNDLDRFSHGSHGNHNDYQSQQFESNARQFSGHDDLAQSETFPEYQLGRQTYPVEDLGIPLADDGSDVEYEGLRGVSRDRPSSGYDSHRPLSGYDHGHGGYVIQPNGGYDRYDYDRGYDQSYEDHVTRHTPVSDHVTRHAPVSDHMTRHAPMSDQPIDIGPVARSYSQVDRTMSRSPLPGHVTRARSPIPDHVRDDDFGLSRSPVSGHMDRTMSRSPAPMSRSPASSHVSMSRSPAPDHVSMSRSPAPGHVMSRSPAPNHVDRGMSRSPIPAFDDYSPQPVYDRSYSPNPGHVSGYPHPRDHRTDSPNPGHVNTHRSVSPAPYVSRSPVPDYISKSPSITSRAPPVINTCFDLSSDDEFSPASPSYRPPLSPNLALSSDDDMMTIGEIKSAMARDEAARPTVAELRRGHVSGGSSGSSRSGTPVSTSANGGLPGSDYRADSRTEMESRARESVSTGYDSSSRSSTPVSASTPTSRANRTWANTSRFSLAERRDSTERTDSRIERPSSRLSYSEYSNTPTDSESVYSSRERLNSSNSRLNQSHSSGLGSSTSSISTFGYDSVGSNVSRGSFRFDMCSARPGSRVSCYDEDFGNVTVETVKEEPYEEQDRSRGSRDYIQDRISRDFGSSRNDILDNPSICLPTGDPHKSRDPSHDPSRDPHQVSRDSTHVKTLPQHVTPCAPPQPSYMSRSVASTRPRCVVCDDHVAMNERIVQTESLQGSRDIYHLRCFRCCICDSSLEHMEHYIDPHSDMLFCHVDYHETFSPKCAQCSSCIEGDYVQAMGKTYHVDHFFCAQCGKPFQEGQQHHIIEGHAYCSPCHDVKTAEKCWRCSHVFNVSDPIIEVLDRLWCETCYSCEECGVGLKEEFTLTNDGVVLCEKCQVKKVKTYAWQ